MKPLPAFEVDKKGLEKILERRGKSFAVLELVQNAFDENVTSVEVTIRPTEGSRGYHDIVVEDDSPEGFADLSHAYTLFAESIWEKSWFSLAVGERRSPQPLGLSPGREIPESIAAQGRPRGLCSSGSSA